MTMIDDRAVTAPAPLTDTTADIHPSDAHTETCAITADGAYRTDALRVVRGTPNAEELAALVAALLLTRRVHERHHLRAPEEEQHRPAWPRDRYTAPGSWAAGS